MEKINVLYIDDQILNLKAFQASFRRLFNIYTARTSAEAKQILNQHEIEVILSDQRMPEASGVDFFESILETHPNPIRILVTAYSDINSVIDAINKGQVYRYITKPWHDFDLKLTIENAYQLYLLKEQNNKLNLKYQRIFTESSDPILIFDLKGRIVDYNKATLDFVKTNKENNLHHRSFNSLLKYKSNTNYIIQKLKSNDSIKDFQCQVLGKNNTTKDCLITINAIRDNYGKIISFQAIIKDFTERNKLNQLLLKTTIEAQEKERERISRDLHDGLGQQLAALRMHLDVFTESTTKHDSDLVMISSILSGTIKDLRKICYNTLPLVLFDNGLINAIDDLTEKTRTTTLDVKFRYSNHFPALTKSLEIAIFRIIQEFVANSIKHGGNLSEINIDLIYNEESITLKLKDNGVGFEVNSLYLQKGHGLNNIRTRVESFDGKLTMESIPRKQTNFDIVFPFKQEENKELN